MDMIWDFETNVSQVGYCKNCPVYTDSYSIFYGTPDFKTYIQKHAQAMGKKKVPVT